METIGVVYEYNQNSGLMFSERDPGVLGAEEASFYVLVAHWEVKLSGKRTGRRTTF